MLLSVHPALCPGGMMSCPFTGNDRLWDEAVFTYSELYPWIQDPAVLCF
jgi:hypothetical protein